jgi:nicotinamide-nucleotide amidase
MLPEGSECLYNPVGTAPGFKLMIERCTIFFVPGVPHEMRHMLSNAVLPDISGLVGKNRAFYGVKTISTFGLTESLTAERLSGIENEFKNIQLGLRAKFPEIQIKLYTSALNEDELGRRLAGASSWVENKVGDYIFSRVGDPMQSVVGGLLKEKNESLAVAESCTGGLISHMLTDVSGSSAYFLFSGVTYSNQAKENVLGVSPVTLQEYGAVHEQTALEMARGARRIAGATYGLSTSGIAGPDGGTKDKPVGTVCIGLASPQTVVGYRFCFSNFNRTRNKQIFAMTALDLLRRHLLGIKSTSVIYHTVMQK